MARRQNALDRIFPTRSLFKGRSPLVMLASAVCSLLLCGTLLCGLVLMDLLVGRGELTVEDSAVVGPAFQVPAEEAESESASGTVVAKWARPGSNRGVLPTLARLEARDSLAAGPLRGLVRITPALRSNVGALVTLLAFAVTLLVMRGVVRRMARGVCRRVAVDTSSRLRRSLHRHALRLGPSDLRDRSGETALELFTQEVGAIQEFVVDWNYTLVRNVFDLVALLLLSLGIAPLLSLQCLIPLAGCWYLVFHEMRRRSAASRRVEDRAENALRRLAESLNNTRLVRGFGMENFEHQEFAEHLDRYQTDLLAIDRSEATSRWAVRVLVAASLGLVLFLVGLKVLSPSRELSLAAATVLLVTFGWMYEPLERLGTLPERRRRAESAADRVMRYLDEMPEVSQAVGAKFLEPLSRELRYDGVTYRTPAGETLLQDFTCTVRGGDVTALVSLDPIEARCVAYMLPRFIEPSSGQVLFDGEDTAWVTLESLRAEAIFVGGEDTFFTGTVFENISCGSSDYKLPEVTEAAKTSHAHNFVQKLPNGYETVLGEHGELLDPGQAFRLGLARAILRNPALLIVEEPDATLDPDTKSLLDDAYDRILPDRTVVLLPRRLSTLRRANRVIVVHGGRIVADGHHADLVKSSPIYRHWEYSRFNEFDRAS